MEICVFGRNTVAHNRAAHSTAALIIQRENTAKKEENEVKERASLEVAHFGAILSYLIHG